MYSRPDSKNRTFRIVSGGNGPGAGAIAPPGTTGAGPAGAAAGTGGGGGRSAKATIPPAGGGAGPAGAASGASGSAPRRRAACSRRCRRRRRAIRACSACRSARDIRGRPCPLNGPGRPTGGSAVNTNPLFPRRLQNLGRSSSSSSLGRCARRVACSNWSYIPLIVSVPHAPHTPHACWPVSRPYDPGRAPRCGTPMGQVSIRRPARTTARTRLAIELVDYSQKPVVRMTGK